MSNVGTPAGWYPDPENPGQSRYWDGAQWAAPSAPAGQPGFSAAQSPGQPGYSPGQGSGGGSSGNKVALIVGGVLLALLLLGGGAYALTSGGDDDDDSNLAIDDDENDDGGDEDDEGDDGFGSSGSGEDVAASEGPAAMPNMPDGVPGSRDEFVDVLVESGFSQSEAECFADGLEDRGFDFDDLASADPSTSEDFSEIASDCLGF